MDEIESQIFILNDNHNDFKYQNFKSQKPKKNRRGKNKWVVRKKTAVDIISYVEEKRCVIFKNL